MATTNKKPAAKSTAKKTTTVKTVAKKTTTMKTAAKKTTATKPVTTKTTPTKKTTTTVKSTVKKTTTVAKTTAKKTAIEISVNGNKKVGTLRKDFCKQFPYLNLFICYSYGRDMVKKGETLSARIPDDKTLASVRRAESGGDISISGNKKIKTLEKEFDSVFGLYVQVCYEKSDGSRYYTSGSADEMTLAAFNKKCEADGCKKGVWK